MEPGIEILVFFTGLLVVAAFFVAIYCAFTLEKKHRSKRKAKIVQRTVAESAKLYGNVANHINSHVINVDPVRNPFAISKTNPNFHSGKRETTRDDRLPKQEELYSRFDTSSNRRYQTPHYLRSKVKEKPSLSDGDLGSPFQLPKSRLISRSQSNRNLPVDGGQTKTFGDSDTFKRHTITGDIRHQSEKESLFWFNKITTSPNYFQSEFQ